MNKEVQDQLNGARNLFFGFLKGVDSKFNIELPDYVYHYTSIDSFYLMVESDTIRMFTVSNFEDKLERKVKLDIESRVSGHITNNETLEKHDFAHMVNTALSNDHVFIQSNTTTSKNSYLWDNYGNKGEGICLRISTAKYIAYLEETLEDFELLPNYLKCCYISYDEAWLNTFLEMLLPAIQAANSKLNNMSTTIWFFFLEYWKNFIKSAEPYEKEKEFRCVVSDNYSLFLFFCSQLARWGLFTTKDSEILSAAFFSEYNNRKQSLHQQLGFTTTKHSSYVTIPFSKVVDSVLIGPNSTMTKSGISKGTNYKIRKSQVERMLGRL
ncbi:hypothetical protein FR932_10010 [Moritella marina ATCC 15381]|uniref:DUF2971 domain-containing protein n=1 Tax=Moritella marina ATCC 15381 TaxID=1202962 RepID=A0A5J6WL45_MORMI|nr:hypothetical protein [Moritella marina]QFI38154.1 hypothetical protein FR932_10010 [Moritella marina ATCC 15381]